MSKDLDIKLKETSILHVPFSSFSNDFKFIVNGRKYETSHVIADLLSPKISQIHLNDPTFDTYIINTRSTGDFSHILDLATFQTKKIANNELHFFNEIIEILGNESFELNLYEDSEEITQDNVINKLKTHLQLSCIYKTNISKEIDFISSNFYDLFTRKESELLELSFPITERIIDNQKLRISDEDQLITFINDLSEQDTENNYFYEYVIFSNLSNEKIREFAEIYDLSYLNYKVWNHISQRLQKVVENTNILPNERYINSGILLSKEGEKFSGIINFLLQNNKDNINKKFKISSSTQYDEEHNDKYSISYDNENRWFASKHIENSWLCFDFMDNRIIPIEYEIRSYPDKNHYSPKSWIIEGSIDKSNWELLDYEIDCTLLYDVSVRRVFKIKNVNGHKFKFIRMQLIGKNWGNSTSLELNSFEIYGTLFLKPE